MTGSGLTGNGIRDSRALQRNWENATENVPMAKKLRVGDAKSEI